MHNIAEGFDAGSDAERHYITQDQFQRIYDQATAVKKLINAFISYLRKSH